MQVAQEASRIQGEQKVTNHVQAAWEKKAGRQRVLEASTLSAEQEAMQVLSNAVPAQLLRHRSARQRPSTEAAGEERSHNPYHGDIAEKKEEPRK